jgi:hypothetical protein
LMASKPPLTVGKSCCPLAAAAANVPAPPAWPPAIAAPVATLARPTLMLGRSCAQRVARRRRERDSEADLGMWAGAAAGQGRGVCVATYGGQSTV